MTTECSWEELSGHCEVIGIIEDQQPLTMRLKPLHNGPDNNSLIFLIFLWQIQPICDGNIPRDQGFISISAYPEDGLVDMPMPISIFQSYLCLSDSAQPT